MPVFRIYFKDSEGLDRFLEHVCASSQEEARTYAKYRFPELVMGHKNALGQIIIKTPVDPSAHDIEEVN